MLPSSEIIGCCRYWELGDYRFEAKDDTPTTELPSGIVTCDIGSIPQFFQRIKDNNKKYVVVSTRSDYGLYYQKEFPVWKDTHKAVCMFVGPETNYRTAQLPPRCNLLKCNPNDTYSIKCYSWTEATFDEIPSNVSHWFVSNCGIRHPKITPVPFGIFDSGGNTKFVEAYQKIFQPKGKTLRDQLLYVNFQSYTNERVDYFNYFADKSVTGITCEKDIPFEQYFQQLRTHKYCLCPVSNGADSYRILECMYLGCIPIVEQHPGLMYIAEYRMPAIMSRNFYEIDLNELDENYLYYKAQNWNSKYLKFSYWKNRIEERKVL